MNVLVLSCNTGQGHNSAGSAIAEKMRSLGARCQMLDALTFAGERFSRAVSSTYVRVTTQTPGVFHMLYRMGTAISNPKVRSPVYLANIPYGKKLMAYLEDAHIDAVITAHIFPAETLTYLKRSRGLRLPCYGVSTDYTCIPFWEESRLDGYFIAHPELVDEYAARGIPREKLMPLGIPVSDAFTRQTSRQTAQEALSIPLGAGPVYLIMTGSMGYGNIAPLLDALLRRGPGQIIVMGGNNNALKQSLRDRYGREDRVRILDYTDRVSTYMDACDVLLTKPGGLTSTEAAVKNVPLIHTRPIPGCETKNARFFSDHGLSLCPEGDVEELACQAAALAADPGRQHQMRQAQRTVIPSSACEAICRRILEDTGERGR